MRKNIEPSSLARDARFNRQSTEERFSDLRDNHMSQQGRDVVINDFNGTKIILEDVRLNQLDAGDFLF